MCLVDTLLPSLPGQGPLGRLVIRIVASTVVVLIVLIDALGVLPKLSFTGTLGCCRNKPPTLSTTLLINRYSMHLPEEARKFHV